MTAALTEVYTQRSRTPVYQSGFYEGHQQHPEDGDRFRSRNFGEISRFDAAVCTKRYSLGASSPLCNKQLLTYVLQLA